MNRPLIFPSGVASDAVFFATFLYAVGFIGNVWVPKTPMLLPLGPKGRGAARVGRVA